MATNNHNENGKFRQYAQKIAGHIAKGGRLEEGVLKKIFSNPSLNIVFIEEFLLLYPISEGEDKEYLEYLIDYAKLLGAIKFGPEEVGKILPEINSSRAISKIMLENDGYANPALKSADAKTRIFDNIVEVSIRDEMKDKMILGNYYFYHIYEMIRLPKKEGFENGYLPKNPLLTEKISASECAYIAQKLDPANAPPEVRGKVRRAFEKFITLILSREAFSPAQRWRNIKREVFYAVAAFLLNRIEGSRFFSDCDARTVLFFNKYCSIKEPNGKEKVRIENSVRGILGELMKECGLKYRPICRNFDPFVRIMIGSEGEETFVLPLNSPITFMLENPMSMISKGHSLVDYRFSLEVYVSIKIGGRFDYKTLLKGEKLRVKAEDGMVKFETILDAKIDKPTVAEVIIKSISPDGQQFAHFMEEIIVLPEGELVLMVKDESFLNVLDNFVKSGKMKDSEAESALVGINRNVPSDDVLEAFEKIKDLPD